MNEGDNLPPIKASGVYSEAEMRALMREMWRASPDENGKGGDPERFRECLARLRWSEVP